MNISRKMKYPKKNIFSFLLFFAAVVAPAPAQICGEAINADDLAFGPGETLNYSIMYSAAVFRTDIADIEIRTSSDKIGSTDCYQIYGRGKTRPFYSVFFDMEDIYISWLEKSTLRPVRMTSELKEGGYRYRQAFDYDWDNMNVHTMGQNIKRERTYLKDMTLLPCSYDALALFYNMRSNHEVFKMKSGDKLTLDLVLEDTIRSVQLRFMGKEKKKVEGLGEFNTLKYGCQIATSSDESFEDGSEFFIWLTDDKNRIPVHLETPIRVGKVTVRLSGWSDLKHPFESVVINTSRRR